MHFVPADCQGGGRRSDPAIIHPHFAAWYKLGNKKVSLIARWDP